MTDRPAFRTEGIPGLGPGKLFGDCSEAERFKRIHYARKLLHEAMQGL